MKEGQKLWSREELLLAINLYCKTPFGKIHSRNPSLIQLAELINRTPSSVAFKLVNFASLDPSLQERGIKGASNTSKLDKVIWDEFYNNWDACAFESEKLIAQLTNSTLEAHSQTDLQEPIKEGKTKEQLVKIRINQAFFRSTILASYNNTCCITGLQHPSLLVAGHIKPWSLDEANRLNPRNGILINALHDKAFENGLLTITPDYKIKISSSILKKKTSLAEEAYLSKYHNQSIILPSRFIPDTAFLQYHNDVRFIQ